MNRCGRQTVVKNFKKEHIGVFRAVNVALPNDVELSRFNWRGSNFRNLPSAYNGNVALPVTFNGDTVYLASNVTFDSPGKKTFNIRFVMYDLEDITDKALSDELVSTGAFEYKLNNGEFPLVSFSKSALDNAPTTSKDAFHIKSYINAFYCSIKYYEFLYMTYGRGGIFDKDHDMVMFVNVRMSNAFWYESYIFYGNAKNEQTILPLTSMDICCHELTHGLTQQTLKLVYSGESGALDESIADMFGTFMEHYIAERGNMTDLPDWIVAENSFGQGIRNFADPGQFEQPDAYKGKFWINPGWTWNDEGGVHCNSGVLNFFCYLAVHGAENGVRNNVNS